MKFIAVCFFILLTSVALRSETTAPESTPASTPTPPGAAKNTVPTVVTSDQYKFDMKNHEGVFTGNVVMTGADFKMKSREMYVYFDDKNAVKRMVSRGDVEIEQPERQTKSGQAEYFADDNKIILTETPQVIESQKTVTGTTITMYRNTNKMDVDGHSRVMIYDNSMDPSKSSSTASTPAPAAK
jgi:lipopolysaccharide export system protein LptA